MSWTPAAGMILKHKAIAQKVKLVESELIGSVTFWTVKEHDRYGDPRPWKIGEQNLLNQYDPEK